jgi:hypothetical protein
MALTDAQKAAVRRYLGYPDINRQAHSEIESALDVLSVEGEELVATLLSSLASIESKLTASWSRAGVERVEDVWFSATGGVDGLRAEGRRLAADLGNIFGLAPVRTPFSAGPSSGAALRG